MSIQLKLSRSNHTYRPSDLLEGKIITNFPSSIYHQGIRLNATGTVNLQVPGGSAGVIEAFYGTVKPISVMNRIIEVQSSGKLGSGTTEIPFSITLKQQGQDNSEPFYETFHGVNIRIQYLIIVDINRGSLRKSLSATMEFIIESGKRNLLEAPISPEMVFFYITQDTQKQKLHPELRSGGFRVTGKISTRCSVLDPINGELTIEASAVPIHSIDIHLLRVESILVGEMFVTETSIIQTTQIADGDGCRNMALPIHVILPRLLTCPTILAGPFSIEFQVAIVISFSSGPPKVHPRSDPQAARQWLASETASLVLVRTKCDWKEHTVLSHAIVNGPASVGL